MKKRVSILLVLVMIIASIFSLTACNNATTTTIKVAVPDGAPALSVTNIVKDGLQLNSNQNLQLDITSPQLIKSSIQGKKVDMAILPTNLAVAIYNASIKEKDKDPYVMIATATYGNLFIVGNSKASLNEMVGGILYSIGQNAIPHKVLVKIAQINNIPLNIINKESEKVADKVNIIFVNDGPVVLEKLNATTDAKVFGLLGEPAVTLSQLKGKLLCCDLQEMYKSATNSEVLGYPQAVLLARKSFVQNNLVLVNHFVQKMIDNVDFINNVENQKLGLENILQNNPYGTKSTLKKVPPKSIKGCNIVVKYTKDAKIDVNNLLNNINMKVVNDDFYYDITK